MEKSQSVYPVGILLGQRICLSLACHGIPMTELEKIVYDCLRQISDESNSGDWVSMPYGERWVKQ